MMTEIHYRISSHHINACTCFWRPIFIGLLSELLLARAGKIIPEDLGLFSFPAGGSTAPSQHCVYIPKQGQLSKTSFTSPSAPPSSNISFKSSQKTCTERISTSDVPTLHNMYWETKCNRLLWGARWTRPCANNLSKQPAQLYDTVHYKQKYATRTVSTHRSGSFPQQKTMCPFSMWGQNVLTCVCVWPGVSGEGDLVWSSVSLSPSGSAAAGSGCFHPALHSVDWRATGSLASLEHSGKFAAGS